MTVDPHLSMAHTVHFCHCLIHAGYIIKTHNVNDFVFGSLFNLFENFQFNIDCSKYNGSVSSSWIRTDLFINKMHKHGHNSVFMKIP